MQTIAAFALVVFLLGLFFGLPYQQAHKRRIALLADDEKKTIEKENRLTPLDKT